ncbi:MAG: hypothetical protein ABL901_14535 [Hyphomicrobiaceae bacterium]
MLITLMLDVSRLWRWHLILIEQLAVTPGTRVAVVFSPVQRPVETAVSLALMLEATLSKRPGPQPFDAMKAGDFDTWFSETTPVCDLVIDLASLELADDPHARTLIPLYNGVPGGSAFWSAVLEGAAPFLSLHDSTYGVLGIGQPAIESPHALALSAAGVVTRLMSGLIAAARDPAPKSGVPHLADYGARAPGLTMPAVQLMGRKVASKAKRLIDRQLAAAPQWAVAWRMREARFDPLTGGELSLADYQLLADDGQRYYADPFAVARGGEVDVFVEELPYATGRGIISMFTVRADGTATTPRPVLDVAHHLSYPQVISRDGAHWMLPECHASGGLTLYRAVRYPDQWEPVARLIDEPVHDATFFEHGGKLWIAANAQGPASSRWGSSWDSLSLYCADKLLGPWTAHAGNPVLIDAARARPAGETFVAGGTLYRPVQDCSAGYGAALGLAQVTRLDDGGFTQEVVGRLSFATGSGVLGPHTLNRAACAGGQFEAIDLFAPKRLLERASYPRPATGS